MLVFYIPFNGQDHIGIDLRIARCVCVGGWGGGGGGGKTHTEVKACD